MRSERRYSAEEVSEIVRQRINKVRAEPSGLAIVVAELVDRVRALEDMIGMSGPTPGESPERE